MTKAIIPLVLSFLTVSPQLSLAQDNSPIFDLAEHFAVSVDFGSRTDVEQFLDAHPELSAAKLRGLVQNLHKRSQLVEQSSEQLATTEKFLFMSMICADYYQDLGLVLYSQSGLAHANLLQGETERALDLFKGFVENAGQITDKSVQAAIKSEHALMFGRALHESGQSEWAKKWLDLAIELAIDDEVRDAATVDLGISEMATGNTDVALDVFSEVASKADAHPDTRLTALFKIALFKVSAGETPGFDETARHMDQLLEAVELQRRSYWRGQIAYVRALMETQIGNFETADNYISVAMENLKGAQLINVLTAKGKLEMARRRPDIAYQQHEQAVIVARQYSALDQLPALLANKGLSKLLEAMLDPDDETHFALLEDAKTEFEAAREAARDSSNRRNTYFIDGDYAIVLSLLNEYGSANEIFPTVIETARELEDLEYLWIYQLHYAESTLAIGETAGAMKLLRDSISTVERLQDSTPQDPARGLAFFFNKQEPFSMLVKLLTDEGRNEEALIVADNAKSRVLQRMVSENLGLSDVDGLTIEKYREVKSFLSDIRVIQYMVTDSGVFVFSMSADEEVRSRFVEIPESDLRAKSVEFTNRIANKRRRFQPIASELYELLLSQELDSVAENKELLIIPDGPLSRLPFNALVDSTGQYLVQRHPCAFGHSLEIIRNQIKAAARIDDSKELNVVLVANPNSNAEESLDGAEITATELSLIYRQIKILPSGGQGATKEEFLNALGYADILQVSAHALFDNSNPFRSRVLLDGIEFVEAGDLLDAECKCRLVILAACETDEGEEFTGDGQVGFSWALSATGCPALIACKWRVDDAATSDIMQRFHRELADATEKHVAKCLRSAIVNHLSSTEDKHPYFWAGIVLSGAQLH